MKGCFFLQRRFAYLGHVMALLLKERYGVNEFCGYVSLRSSYEFLRSQKEIAYTGLVLEEEIYDRYRDEPLDVELIRSLEAEYGLPNLWPYLLADRVIRSNQLVRAYPYDKSRYTHEEMMRLLQVTAKAVITFLDEQKPDFIVFSIVGNLGSLLLYHIAQKRGIRTFFIDCGRLETRYFFSERFEKSTFLHAAFDRRREATPNIEDAFRKEARRLVGEFQKDPKYYLVASAAAAHADIPGLPAGAGRPSAWKRLVRSIRWTFVSLAAYARDPHKTDYTTIHPLWELWDKMLRKFRKAFAYGNLFDRPVSGESFAYFALHSEPESYPMVLAPFYMDQLWLVKQIARSLPLDFKLYVKDHPAMLGFRPPAYYAEMKKIPNVRLLDPRTSGLELTRSARLVLTLTGTSAWEAVLLKKPAIIFGNMFYDCLSAVKRCHDIETLPSLVQEQLNAFSYDKDELIDFVAALLEESVPVDFVQIWDQEGGSDRERTKSQFGPLMDLLARKLGLAAV